MSRKFTGDGVTPLARARSESLPADLRHISIAAAASAVHRYMVAEVQRVYRSQGVTINDKHIEIIVRQMLRKVRIEEAGDTELLPMELFDRFEFEDINARTIAAGGEPATAQTVLLGVRKASLSLLPPEKLIVVRPAAA